MDPQDSLYWSKDEEDLAELYFNRNSNPMILAALLNRESSSRGMNCRIFSALNVSQKWSTSERPTLWIPDGSEAPFQNSATSRGMLVNQPSGSQTGDNNIRAPVAVMQPFWRSTDVEGASNPAPEQEPQASSLQYHAMAPPHDVTLPPQRLASGRIEGATDPAIIIQDVNMIGKAPVGLGLHIPAPITAEGDKRPAHPRSRPAASQALPHRHDSILPSNSPMLMPQYTCLAEIHTITPNSNLLCATAPTPPRNIHRLLTSPTTSSSFPLTPLNIWTPIEESLSRHLFHPSLTPAAFATRLNYESRRRSLRYRNFTAVNVSQKWKRLEPPTYWIGEERVDQHGAGEGQARASGVQNGKDRGGLGIAAEHASERDPSNRRWGVQQFLAVARLSDSNIANSTSAQGHNRHGSSLERKADAKMETPEKEAEVNVCETAEVEAGRAGCGGASGAGEAGGFASRGPMTGADGDPFMGSSYCLEHARWMVERSR